MRKWILRGLLILLFAGAIWVINLIWFRPFNIRHFYDKVFFTFALQNPQMVSGMGLPVLSDIYNDKLNDYSLKKDSADFEFLKKIITDLSKYDYDKQSPSNKLNTDILRSYLSTQAEGEKFMYYGYPVNQMGGIQNGFPSFMESTHLIKDKEDAEAYISRLNQFPEVIEDVLEGLKLRESMQIIPPTFVIERVLSEMNGFVGTTEEGSVQREIDDDPVRENILYFSFEEKLDEFGKLSEEEKTELLDQVYLAVNESVFPSYKKLIDYFDYLLPLSDERDGVWKLPNGDEYYRYRLKSTNSIAIDPEEIHQIGLSEVERIEKEMWGILVSQGYDDTTRTVSEYILELNKENRFLFPNDDSGRELAITEYQEIIDHINANLEDLFDLRPKSIVEVKRVPEFREEGSAGAYYSGPALDGSRPGIFYANLRDMNEVVKFGMKTLAYHEAIPGHHFQIALAQELEGFPMFRKILGFTSYTEGWALYAERLAWEYGFYENDPFGNLGRLQAEMFRAVRLVVDSGIHYKKWTREEAIDYMVDHTGMSPSEVTTEIERYIVWPGQATGYKIGMIKILEFRDRAMNQLGDQFDIKEFHNVVLGNGALPLEILEQLVDEYIQEKKSV
ncbi:MAG: DUF885 domain-containing protein [Cyclobacteriaceae bacterium]|jgi:uncharacterized protein (DUF885 family)